MPLVTLRCHTQAGQANCHLACDTARQQCTWHTAVLHTQLQKRAARMKPDDAGRAYLLAVIEAESILALEHAQHVEALGCIQLQQQLGLGRGGRTVEHTERQLRLVEQVAAGQRTETGWWLGQSASQDGSSHSHHTGPTRLQLHKPVTQDEPRPSHKHKCQLHCSVWPPCFTQLLLTL